MGFSPHDPRKNRGNVPQNLTDAVTVVFATPRSDRGKGGMKGMSLGMGGEVRGWSRCGRNELGVDGHLIMS